VYLDTGASFILQWNSLEVLATKSKFLSIAAAAFKLATFTRSSMTVASAILLGNVIAVFVRTLFICTFGGPILGIGHRAAAHINGRSLLLVRLITVVKRKAPVSKSASASDSLEPLFLLIPLLLLGHVLALLVDLLLGSVFLNVNIRFLLLQFQCPLFRISAPTFSQLPLYLFQLLLFRCKILLHRLQLRLQPPQILVLQIANYLGRFLLILEAIQFGPCLVPTVLEFDERGDKPPLGTRPRQET